MFVYILRIFILLIFVSQSLQTSFAYQSTDRNISLPRIISFPGSKKTAFSIKGLVLDVNEPFKFGFIAELGKGKENESFKTDDGLKVMKYFLAALALPEDSLWVNLSPYEKNRVIDEKLGFTLLGKDLLEEDFILKQTIARMIHPDSNLGKKFWSQVYAANKDVDTKVAMNSFSKVWIMPHEAAVWENQGRVLITKSSLKVMLEEDYLANKKATSTTRNAASNIDVKNLMRANFLPQLEREVNEGADFANLRLMYQSMILATWYKKSLKNSIINKLYGNKFKINGIDEINPKEVQALYEKYLNSVKKGVFNFIREEQDQRDGAVFPRKYFSGGFVTNNIEGESLDKSMIIAQGFYEQQSSSTRRVIEDELRNSEESFLFWGEVKPIDGDGEDMSMLGTPKVLISNDFKERVSNIGKSAGRAATLYLIPLAYSILYYEENGSARFVWNIHMYLAAKAQGVFEAVAYNPANYKIMVVGVGISVALLAWQNYSIRGLAALLKEGSTDDREVVTRLKSKGKESLPILLDLYQRKPYEGNGLLDFFVALKDKRAINVILNLLKSGKVEPRKATAALKVLDARNDEIIYAIIEAFNKYSDRMELFLKSSDGNNGLLDFLNTINDKRIIPVILKLFNLGKLHPAEATEALRKLGASQDEIIEVNISAINLHPGLIELLDKDPQIKGGILEYLVSLKDKRSIPVIMDLLKVGKVIPKDANAALKILGAGRDAIVDANLAAINSKNQAAIIEELGNLGDIRAAEELVGFLKRGQKIDIVYEALVKLGMDKEKVFREILNDVINNNLTAVGALVKFGDSRAIEVLIQKLESPGKYGQELLQALKKLGLDANRMFDAYISQLTSENVRARVAAIEGLGGLADQRAVGILFEIMKKQTFMIERTAIARSLRILGSEKGFSIEELTLIRLSERQSAYPNFDLFDFKIDALKFANEGYDFEMVLTPEEGHYVEEGSPPYTSQVYVITRNEDLSIKRGERLDDQASLGKSTSIETSKLMAIESVVAQNDQASLAMPNRYSLPRELIHQAQEQGKIDISSVKDPSISLFLKFLRDNALKDIVLVGGSVRDIFYGMGANDLDFTISIEMNDEERRLAQIVGSQTSPRILAKANMHLEELADALGVPVERFFSKENPPTFNGIQLHYLGPRKFISSVARNELYFQGMVVDSVSETVFSSYTAPSLLQMAINGNGKLYGHRIPLADLFWGTVRLSGDLQEGRNLFVAAIIKMLRLKYEFGLEISDSDYELISKAITREQSWPKDNIEKARLIAEIRGIYARVDRKDSFKEELSRFGILQKMNIDTLEDRMMKTEKPVNAALSREERIEHLWSIYRWLAQRDQLPNDYDLIWVGGSKYLPPIMQAVNAYKRNPAKIIITGGIGRDTAKFRDLKTVLDLPAQTELEQMLNNLNQVQDNAGNEAMWLLIESKYGIKRGRDAEIVAEREAKTLKPGHLEWRHFLKLLNPDRSDLDGILNEMIAKGISVEEYMINQLIDPATRDGALVPEALVYYAILRSQNVPDSDILIDAQSTTGLENVQYGAEILKRQGIIPNKIVSVHYDELQRRTVAALDRQLKEYFPIFNDGSTHVYGFAPQSMSIADLNRMTEDQLKVIQKSMLAEMDRFVPFFENGSISRIEFPQSIQVARETLQKDNAIFVVNNQQEEFTKGGIDLKTLNVAIENAVSSGNMQEFDAIVEQMDHRILGFTPIILDAQPINISTFFKVSK